MGTNYYLKLSQETLNTMFGGMHPKLIQYIQPIIESQYNHHIGKASGGWKFLFQLQTIPQGDGTGKFLDSFEKWKEVIMDPDYVVEDEYGSIVDKKEFIKIVDFYQTKKSSYVGLPGFNGFKDGQGYEFSYEDFS